MTRAVFCRLLLAAVAGCCFVAPLPAQVQTAPAAYEPAAPLAKLDLKDGDSIVFLGDSITHQRLYTQYVEDFFYTRFPKMRLKFHNAGVGGARAWDALQRFDQDVAAYKPKYVTVLLGMNDGTYQPFDAPTFETYHRDMTTVISRIREIGATPVLMTPTMYDSRASRMYAAPNRIAPAPRLEFYNSVLTYYGTWLREVATEHGYGFVDMWGPLNNLTLQARRTDPKFTMIRDAVHPDAPGQVVMAVALIDDTGLRGPLSSIRVMLAPKPKSNAQGGQISELGATEDGVEFVWTADALPWVLPEEAAIGVSLTKLGHRNSREALEVHGLKPGRYELSIDGSVVGTFAHDALARHIELQENAKTPQHQQALAVAMLNKERNEGPISELRNEWRVFQQYSRLKANPQRTEAQNAELAGLEQRLEGMNERVTKAEEAARAIEDRIFETNQPKPRKFALKRVVAERASQ